MTVDGQNDAGVNEDAFRFLSGLSRAFRFRLRFRFRLGSPDTPTAASCRLLEVEAVQALLSRIGRRAES